MPTIDYAHAGVVAKQESDLVNSTCDLGRKISECHCHLDEIAPEPEGPPIASDQKSNPHTVTGNLSSCIEGVGYLAHRLERLKNITGRVI
jgi:hypothetical protein